MSRQDGVTDDVPGGVGTPVKLGGCRFDEVNDLNHMLPFDYFSGLEQHEHAGEPHGT